MNKDKKRPVLTTMSMGLFLTLTIGFKKYKINLFINKLIYFMEMIKVPAKKQISREMILSAAFELLRKGGREAVNVKALANRLHCSTQPVYLSFSGMDALRTELGATALQKFAEEMQQMSEDGVIRLYGMQYIQYAMKEKEVFKFLFMRQNSFDEMKQLLRPITEQAIQELMKRYEIDHEEAHYFHDQLWMHTHGIAAMAATEFCQWDMKKVERMLSECELYLGRKYETTSKAVVSDKTAFNIEEKMMRE